MLTLFLIILLAALGLALFLYVGSLLLQGTYYTEPSQSLAWGAPAAGLGLGLFLLLWCVLIRNAPGASPSAVPYDTFARFSPTVDVVTEPAKDLFAIKKNGEQVHYVRYKEASYGLRDSRIVYRTDQDTPQPWRNQGVEKIVLVIDNEKQEFKLVPQTKEDRGRYRQYVSSQGWIMQENDDGPTGVPVAYRWGRFFVNLLLNFAHLALWFAAFWLLLRFQWPHALGLAIAAWLVFSLALLPMLLDYAATLAER